jgi:hypothetical protein
MPVDTETPKGRYESKEKLGDSLLLARLIPSDTYGTFDQIVGIPFESYQLEPIEIKIENRSFKLLDIMQELNLIGGTQGVPHLSVGGSSKSVSDVESSAARSYLVKNGQGVQGMGLVQYEQGINADFGLGLPFMRSSGIVDVGGGMESYNAASFQNEGDRFWLESILHSGKPKFARILNVFPYQSWMKFKQEDKNIHKTSVTVREDGKRGVPRKILLNAILDLLPHMADEFAIPDSSFEIDGHNAFMRDGEVIFTDYESHDELALVPYDFMHKLSNAWYFDEFRKDFGKFCDIFAFSQTGNLHEANNDTIRQHVTEVASQAAADSSLQVDLFSSDKKLFQRHAIAGLIASRAIGRFQGRSLIKQAIYDFIYSSKDGTLHLQDAYSHLHTLSTEQIAPKNNIYRDTVQIIRTEEGRLAFSIILDTYGLPVEPTLTIPIDYSDIFYAWPFNQEIENYEKLNLRDIIEPAEFSYIPEDAISSLLYSQLAGACANIYDLKLHGFSNDDDNRLSGFAIAKQGGTKQYVGYYKSLLYENNRLYRVTFEGSDNVMFETRPSQGMVVISVKNDEALPPISDLNKLAYAAHVALMAQVYSSESDVVEIRVAGI